MPESTTNVMLGRMRLTGQGRGRRILYAWITSEGRTVWDEYGNDYLIVSRNMDVVGLDLARDWERSGGGLGRVCRYERAWGIEGMPRRQRVTERMVVMDDDRLSRAARFDRGNRDTTMFDNQFVNAARADWRERVWMSQFEEVVISAPAADHLNEQMRTLFNSIQNGSDRDETAR